MDKLFYIDKKNTIVHYYMNALYNPKADRGIRYNDPSFKIKFPIKTPTTKEEYYYRSLFSNHFPSNTAAMSVPQEPSVACSTKIALEWDEAFKVINEPSGRAISKVHQDAY